MMYNSVARVKDDLVNHRPRFGGLRRLTFVFLSLYFNVTYILRSSCPIKLFDSTREVGRHALIRSRHK